jgi:hypothetical protein
MSSADSSSKTRQRQLIWLIKEGAWFWGGQKSGRFVSTLRLCSRLTTRVSRGRGCVADCCDLQCFVIAFLELKRVWPLINTFAMKVRKL